MSSFDHPLLGGMAPSRLTRHGWRVLSAGSFEPGLLRALGFARPSELDAARGAVLVPRWWRLEDEVHVVGHLLRLDAPALRPGRYDRPKGSSRQPALSAHGALRDDFAPWSSVETPLVLVEGERAALWLTTHQPAWAVVALPGPWTLDEPGVPSPQAAPLAERLLEDLGALRLDGRLVVLLGDADAPSLLLRRLTAGLGRRQALAVLAPPPPGCPGRSLAWLEALQADPDAPRSLEAWRAAAGAQAHRAPAPAPRSARESSLERLAPCLPEAERAGSEELRLPPDFRVRVEPDAAWLLGRTAEGEVLEVASAVFWPVAHVQLGPKHLLELAVLRCHGGALRRSRCMLSRSLLHEVRKLAGALQDEGINVLVGAEEAVGRYLTTFLSHNALPTRVVRSGTGWDAARRSFQYGSDCVGGQDLFELPAEDEGSGGLFGALRTAGSAAVWKEAMEDLLALSPAAALVLAASVASPMVGLFEWPSMGLLLGALGGAGKSTLLRAAASVYGASGPLSASQPSGLVGQGTGTPKGLLLQFRRFSDLPHLLDEIKPALHHAHQRDELADVLHQLYEGQEHSRATRSSTGTRALRGLRGCLVAAGEVAAGDFLRKGGTIRRLLPPPAPYSRHGAPLGAFGPIFAAHHGHLGRDLIEALVATTAEERRAMSGYHAFYHEDLGVTVDAPEHLRSWARQIGTAKAAVDVCLRLCPELCPAATRWKLAIAEAWEQLRDTEAGPRAGDLLGTVEDKIRSWVARHRLHLVPSRALREKFEHREHLSPEERAVAVPRDPVLGQVVSAENEGEPGEVLGKVDIFQTSLTKFLADEGYSEGTLTGALRQRGFLETTVSQTRQSNVARLSRIHGTSVRVYRLVLTASNLAEEPPRGATGHATQEPTAAGSEGTRYATETVENGRVHGWI